MNNKIDVLNISESMHFQCVALSAAVLRIINIFNYQSMRARLSEVNTCITLPGKLSYDSHYSVKAVLTHY